MKYLDILRNNKLIILMLFLVCESIEGQEDSNLYLNNGEAYVVKLNFKKKLARKRVKCFSDISNKFQRGNIFFLYSVNIIQVDICLDSTKYKNDIDMISTIKYIAIDKKNNKEVKLDSLYTLTAVNSPTKEYLLAKEIIPYSVTKSNFNLKFKGFISDLNCSKGIFRKSIYVPFNDYVKKNKINNN